MITYSIGTRLLLMINNNFLSPSTNAIKYKDLGHSNLFLPTDKHHIHRTLTYFCKKEQTKSFTLHFFPSHTSHTTLCKLFLHTVTRKCLKRSVFLFSLVIFWVKHSISKNVCVFSFTHNNKC